LAKDKSDVCIIVSDTTRPVPNSVIFPPVIEALERTGVKDKNITILIANETHNLVPQNMFEELLGKETLKHSLRIVNHNAYDDSTLVNLGKGREKSTCTKDIIPVNILM
jgi:nickel-dependent lactate racemase